MPSISEITDEPMPRVGVDAALVTITGGMEGFDGREMAVACVIVALAAVVAGDVGEFIVIGEGKEVATYSQTAIPIRTHPSKPKETLDQNEILGIITFMASIPPPNKLMTSATQPAIASIDGRVISSSLI